MYDNLLTPGEVIRLAFAGGDYVPETEVGPALIATAQYKFIRPVLGAPLIARMAQGAYPELLEGFVAPALALYVRLLMLPSMAAHAGAHGVTSLRTATCLPADGQALSRLRRQTRSDAAALLRRAVERIEAGAQDYPEYDARANVLHRCTMAGDLIL